MIYFIWCSLVYIIKDMSSANYFLFILFTFSRQNVANLYLLVYISVAADMAADMVYGPLLNDHVLMCIC